jgi:hypothetical protein
MSNEMKVKMQKENVFLEKGRRGGGGARYLVCFPFWWIDEYLVGWVVKFLALHFGGVLEY